MCKDETEREKVGFTTETGEGHTEFFFPGDIFGGEEASGFVGHR